MFTVKLGLNAFICTRTVKLLESKVLSVSDAVCKVEVPLGVSSDSKAVKTLQPMFEKALAAAEKRSEHFLASIQNESAGLEKMLAAFDKRPAAERTQKNFDALVGFVKTENDRIATLWSRWCDKHAPAMAAEALQSCLKATRDKGVQELAAARKQAVGSAPSLPKFQIVAGAVAIATGGVAGSLLGAVKVVAAYLEHQRNTQNQLKAFSDEHKAVLDDLATFGKAIDALQSRIARVDAHRTSLETSIIQNTQDAQKIQREMGELKSGSSGDAAKDIQSLQRALAATESSTQALTAQIVDPAPLEASLKAIRAEHARMSTHLKNSATRAEAASKDMISILKTIKESGDILNGLASGGS